MSYQDSSLLISTFTNDLAIVPDIFTTRKRSRGTGEDLLDHFLYEQNILGEEPKRHCPLPNTQYIAQSDFYLQPSFQFEMQQAIKEVPTLSFVSNAAAPEARKSNQEKIHMVILEEPEQFYRARYDSEGVRAPLKGINENYPAVELRGEGIKHAVVTVKLVHEDGSPHTCCSLDSSDDRKKALTKRASPINNMIKAEFEDLRIRREKKKEGRKSASNVDKSGSRDGKCDKVAYLLFTANVDTSYGQIKCSAISSPISLTAAPEPAELDWLVPTRGHFGGKEVVAIKGSKMTSPKVIFRIRGMGGELIELPGTVDKEKSHQNVLLIRTPIIDHLSYGLGHQRIEATVVVITGRNQMCSNNLDFEFIPNDICRECMQETPMTTIQTNLCQASSSTTCAVGLSPCSPPSGSPRMQRSPGPIYSPTFVQTGLPSPPSTSPFHDQLDMVPLTPSVHSPLTIPTRDAGLQPTISCGSYEAYGPSAQEMNTNILQIVEQLMSPASSEPNAPPPYSCSDVVPLYTTAPCDSTSPDGPAFTDMAIQIQKALVALQVEGRISANDYLFYENECRQYNVDLFKAFDIANGDLLTFQQQLASFKPPISLHSTHL